MNDEYTYIFMAFDGDGRLVAAKKVICEDDEKYQEAYDAFEEETTVEGSAETIGVMTEENHSDISSLDTNEFYDTGI